jgi:hypothetical protein
MATSKKLVGSALILLGAMSIAYLYWEPYSVDSERYLQDIASVTPA